MSGLLYLAVVQAILIFGSETWVVTLHMGRILGSFHHMVARRLLGVQPRIRTYGIWEYPPLEGALQATGLETMETYISRHQNTVA